MNKPAQIKFGTDGWRAIIAEDYTLENLRRVCMGTVLWMKKNELKSALIGHDCRFGGRLFLEESARVFASHGIKVFVADGFVSTPMISLGVVQHKVDLGIVITASHNPPSYNGYKLKSSYGGPTSPAQIEEVEALIPDEYAPHLERYEQYLSQGQIAVIPLQNSYVTHIRNRFDLDEIHKKTAVAYDAMYGAGQEVMKELFPNLRAFHCEWNPGFMDIPPEPIPKNLVEISRFLKSNPGKYLGIANDGDADRVAMLDDEGNLIDSHHILLLLLYYLAGIKKMKGDVVVSFSVTNKVKKLADYFDLKTTITKIGFKYIAEHMIDGDVLVAGEESGGLAIKGHIPERDGIWIALTVLEFVALSGKPITQLIREIYDIVGPFAYDRLDLKLWPDQMKNVKHILNSGPIVQWGSYTTRSFEQLDGYKYYFDHDNWLMFRASGTEPVLRIYAQGRDADEVIQLLDTARKILNI
ncbi:MAG: phosphoglucomutase/phosphomannomutase family protein [Saprospiraceae bacterium]|nr:phosphoglucomutase/phosphomannomutase family protein [Candidatus Vicinibacter proximus]